MLTASPWQAIIDSPVLTVHPGKDKPERDLKIRRTNRDLRLIAYIALMSVLPLITICLLIQSHLRGHQWTWTSIAPFAVMEVFMAGILTVDSVRDIPCWRVRGGDFPDYSEIKRSLDGVNMILFGADADPSYIYNLSVDELNQAVAAILIPEAKRCQKLKDGSVILEQHLSTLPIEEELRTAAINDAHRFISNVFVLLVKKYETMRAVGLGEDNINKYFETC